MQCSTPRSTPNAHVSHRRSRRKRRGVTCVACDRSGENSECVGHSDLRGVVDPRKSGRAASPLADIARYALDDQRYSYRQVGLSVTATRRSSDRSDGRSTQPAQHGGHGTGGAHRLGPADAPVHCRHLAGLCAGVDRYRRRRSRGYRSLTLRYHVSEPVRRRGNHRGALIAVARRTPHGRSRNFAEAYLVAQAEASGVDAIVGFDRPIARIASVTRRDPQGWKPTNGDLRDTGRLKGA
jgi:hypothetical protein